MVQQLEDWVPELEPPADDRVSIISTSEIARQQAGGFLYANGAAFPDDVVNPTIQQQHGKQAPLIDHARQAIFLNIGRKLWSLMPFLLDGTWAQSGDGLWHIDVVIDPTNPQHYTINVQHPAVINGAQGPQGIQGATGAQGPQGIQGVAGPSLFAPQQRAGLASISNSASQLGLTQIDLPQANIAAGKIWRYTAWGTYDATLASDVCTLTLLVGSQAICSLVTPGAAGNNVPWYLEVWISASAWASPSVTMLFNALTKTGASAEWLTSSGRTGKVTTATNPLAFYLAAQWNVAKVTNRCDQLGGLLEIIG